MSKSLNALLNSELLMSKSMGSQVSDPVYLLVNRGIAATQVEAIGQMYNTIYRVIFKEFYGE
jgi:hypothetical protein